MPNLSKKDIKKLVGNGDTENALESLLTSLSEENKNYNKFTLLKGQWATAQEQIRLGLENRKTVDLVFNRITDATLSLVEALSDTDLINTQNKHNTRKEIQKISNLNSVNYKYDIFFSFSSKDIDEAKELCNQLRGYGLRVFFSADDMRLKGGHQFSEVIDEALENSCHFLLHCTPNSMVSEWVKIEYTTFHDQIYISDRKSRSFLIFEGINFDEKLLRISYRNIQRINDVNEILNILLHSLKGKSGSKTEDKKEKQAEVAGQKRLEDENSEYNDKTASKIKQNQYGLMDIAYVSIVLIMLFSAVGMVIKTFISSDDNTNTKLIQFILALSFFSLAAHFYQKFRMFQVLSNNLSQNSQEITLEKIRELLNTNTLN